MIVLDTHAWLWWVTGSRSLSGRARSAIRRDRAIRVPAIACWEVMLLAERGRIRLSLPREEWVRTALATENVALEPLSVEISSQAIAYHAALGGDPADCMVAATARVLKAPLVTSDERIAELPGVHVIW